MGLIQDIEGLFGFGKKATTPAVDAAAVKAAEAKVQSILAAVAGLENDPALTTVAAAVPTVAVFVSFAKTFTGEAQAVLSIIEGLTPSPTPAPAPATPVS